LLCPSNSLATKLSKLDGECSAGYHFPGSSSGTCLKICDVEMYDSCVFISIDFGTSNSYHADICISSQNINTSRGGVYRIAVFGDEENVITPNILVQYSTGSRAFHIFFKAVPWANLVFHIYTIAVAAYPTNVCVAQNTIPTTDLLTVNNHASSYSINNSLPSNRCNIIWYNTGTRV